MTKWRTYREEQNPKSPYRFRGGILRVGKAPEPSDVFWTNAGVHFKEKCIRRSITLFLTLLILAGFCLLIYLLDYYKKTVSLKKDDG